jgi:hypothetical protein
MEGTAVMNEIIWFDRAGGGNPLAGANKWR